MHIKTPKVTFAKTKNPTISFIYIKLFQSKKLKIKNYNHYPIIGLKFINNFHTNIIIKLTENIPTKRFSELKDPSKAFWKKTFDNCP